jgi:hypothetical protein
MIKQGNLMVASITEFASWLVSKIDKDNVLSKPFPACDFCLLTKEDLKYVKVHNPDCDISETIKLLETIKSNATGWYGIKSIDMGFGSPVLYIVADYYGGRVGDDSAHTMRLIRMYNNGSSVSTKPSEVKYTIKEFENTIKALIFDIENFDKIFDDYSDLSSDSIMLLINIVNNDKN